MGLSEPEGECQTMKCGISTIVMYTFTGDTLPNESPSCAELNSMSPNPASAQVVRYPYLYTVVGETYAERTNIVLPLHSSFLFRRYFASTIPAGHICPPHPSFKSSCNLSGGLRRLLKERVVMPADLGGREGTKSSLIEKERGSVDAEVGVGDGEVDMLDVALIQYVMDVELGPVRKGFRGT